ncbi:MAG: hypothetical protein RL447_387, partial [Bacteroidota bacterium]
RGSEGIVEAVVVGLLGESEISGFQSVRE